MTNSLNGFIINWNYVCDNGKKAGDMLRSGEAKLLMRENKIYLKVDGDKEYKVKAGLASGILRRFWI